VLLVVAGGGLAGLAVARRYARRPAELRQLQSALQMLETEITYASTILPDALGGVASRCDRSVAVLFTAAREELLSMQGDTAAEAWEKALLRFYPDSNLTSADLAVLRTLGGVLGISDGRDQAKHLSLAREQLQSQIARADRDAAGNVKLWSYLGFLGALAVVILIY
jgi:stage III sporulation protein AB